MILFMTITGKDRPGIIAKVTEAVYRSGGNLEDASMTILEGEFAMIVLVGFPQTRNFKPLAFLMKRIQNELRLSIDIKEIKHRLRRGEKHVRGTVPYAISVVGPDQTGIVYHVSSLLASRRLNITDLNSKIIGTGARSIYALVLEVDIPKKKMAIPTLKRDFARLSKKLHVDIAINPIQPARF